MSLEICWTRTGDKTHLTTDGKLTLCGRERDESTGTTPAGLRDNAGCAGCELMRDVLHFDDHVAD